MREFEATDNLPAGWINTTIAAISNSIQYGYTASACNDNVGSKFLRITDIQDNSVEWENVPCCALNNKDDLDKYLLRPGDIVFARTGATVGKSYLIQDNVPSEAIFASYLIRINLASFINPKFVYDFFQSRFYWEQIKESSSGIGQPNVNGKKLGQIILSLPPIPEQHRIVARIEELFSRLDAGVEALRRARAQLQRYRQSVLQAAVEGRLTTEWRAAHPEVAYGGLPSNQVDISDLPNNWITENLKKLCIDITDGDHQPPPQSSEGIPFLVISNIRKGILDFENTRFVSREYYDSIPEIRKPSKGDILYSLVGSYGIPVIVDTDRKFCFQRHIGLIRPQKSVDVKYLYYFLKSNLAYKQATGAATGTAQMTVSLKGLRNFKVPFPPLMEQKEIVSKVDQVFLVSDRLEATIESNLNHLDHLRQSILKHAFQGELVPQDPNDEPAGLLLERIRAERIEESPKRGRRKSTHQARLAQ